MFYLSDQLGEEPEMNTATKTCRYCEIEIQFEIDRWVDVVEGGVYDYCADRDESEQEGGHRP